jgi:hypothetical protein
VPVRATALIEGCRLRHPILDRQHMLLLAAGAMITERFKELLRDRGVQEVLLHEDDASAASAPAGSGPAGAVLLTSELADRLDELVDSGSPFSADPGPRSKSGSSAVDAPSATPSGAPGW